MVLFNMFTSKQQSVQTTAIYTIFFNKNIKLVLQELPARITCKDLTF